jgi:membrane protein
MLGNVWLLIKQSVSAFIDDEALTRGAASAFYTVTSIGPVLFIVVAIAGLVFGEDAARGPISDQLGGLMGQQGPELLQTAIQNASKRSSGILAAAVGIGTLVITASDVFTEMHQTLNVIWRTEPRGTTGYRPSGALRTTVNGRAKIGPLSRPLLPTPQVPRASATPQSRV